MPQIKIKIIRIVITNMLGVTKMTLSPIGKRYLKMCDFQLGSTLWIGVCRRRRSVILLKFHQKWTTVTLQNLVVEKNKIISIEKTRGK